MGWQFGLHWAVLLVSPRDSLWPARLGLSILRWSQHVCGGWCWLLAGPLFPLIPHSQASVPVLHPLAVFQGSWSGAARTLEAWAWWWQSITVSLSVGQSTSQGSSGSGGREIDFPACWEEQYNHMVKGHVYRDGRNSYYHLCKLSTTQLYVAQGWWVHNVCHSFNIRF